MLDHQLAATTIFLIAGCGMIFNWFITIFIRRLKSLQNPFGRLTGSQAIGEAVHQTVFALYFAPMVFFDRNTTIIIFFTWACALLPPLYLYVYNDCNLYYIDEYYHFAFTNNPTCLLIAWYADFMKYCSFVVIICTIDIVTVLRVHLLNVSMKTATSNRQHDRKRREEINFLKQACLQAGVFAIELVTYFLLDPMFQNYWVKFFLTTAAWNLVHSTDGFVTIFFNKEFRTVIPCFKSQASIVPTNRTSQKDTGVTPATEQSAYNSGKLDSKTIEKNPFGRLTGSQALGEAIHQTLFALYFSPMVFFDIPWMKENAKHVGAVLLMCYDICIYSHFFISLNRMCAIFLPLKYNKIFNHQNTTIIIFFTWTVSITSGLYFYFYNDCSLYYAGDFHHFTFTINDTCMFIAWYCDFMKYITFVIAIVVIDLTTVFKVHLLNLSMRDKTSNRYVGRKRQEEINFLKQACFQAFVFCCELVSYFLLEPHFTNLWTKFFLSTVAWNLVHSTDGLITIFFNREFRTVIPCLKKPASITPSGNRNQKGTGITPTTEQSAYSSGKPESRTLDKVTY
ncbi:hypothetical protein WR25_12597 [Diploscapter pachys]|uniref:G-protein coupled receptors family 1 profile domain-containing protein n=1 Tax=Diploscapter pachys TaxID=2018661 RepID=A0A2A2KNY7_9BILA|nr:hypothetical protein WR25_12597 [Diploscapter pachys]